MVLDVIPYSSSVRDVPGAQRELAIGLKVGIEPIQNISTHFLPQLQFLTNVQHAREQENLRRLTEDYQDHLRSPIPPCHYLNP